MNFISQLPLVAQMFVLALFAYQAFRLIIVRRQVMRAATDRRQQSAQGEREEPWHWSEPPADLELAVESDERVSRLTLPVRHTVFEVICCLLGYATALLPLVLLVSWARSGKGSAVVGLVAIAVMLWVAWLLLHGDSKLHFIELRPNGATFFQRIGVFFYRHVRISGRRAVRVRFETDVQSALAMTVGQTMPQSYLWVSSFMRRRRFILDVNPSALSWIEGGLEQWRRAASR